MTKAISIRQPWAWLILNGEKDIENRNWPTRVRGRVLIHAAKYITEDDDARDCAAWCGIQLPSSQMFERGGIVGSVEIIDCVTQSESPWFCGRYGFVLCNPQPLPFFPCRGKLGFFDVEMAT